MTNLRGLPDIDKVAPFSTKDEACFKELKEVLQKHNALTRFGISLLHDHFDIDDDEVLVETCDPERRILISQPVKRSDLAGVELVETNWRLDAEQAIKTCRAACVRGPGGGHIRVHYPI
jgi:hypothetical protein